jgi:lysophospholipase L1-like esterase
MERRVIYQNNFKHLINVTVFEGTHEMPSAGDPLQHVPSQQILAIGDSNGATSGGWVDQLQALRPQDIVINTCVSGNTIGFDNLGKQELNTLKNIERYIKTSTGKLDKIVLMLGTNDSKAIFNNKEKEVAKNLEALISQIKSIVAAQPKLGNPIIYIVSPPPFAPDSQLDTKYHGGAQRVAMLADMFEKSAKKMNVQYINVHRHLQTIFPYISNDGVHLTSEGQAILAKIIQEKLLL